MVLLHMSLRLVVCVAALSPAFLGYWAANTKSAILMIEVRSSATGLPAAGVELIATHVGVAPYSGRVVGPLDGRLGAFPLTGVDGRARFTLEPGKYQVQAQWGERRQGRIQVEIPELLSGEERTEEIILPSANDLLFQGRVLEEFSGAAIVGAEVLLYEGSSWGSSWPVYQASDVLAELAGTVTDATGAFEVCGPSWKRCMVRVRAPGHTAGFFPLMPGHGDAASALVLALHSSGDLVARVKQAGRPVAGIGVVVSLNGVGSWAAETDGVGCCRLADLPGGVPLDVSLWWPEPEHNRTAEGNGPSSCLASEPAFPQQRLVQTISTAVNLRPGETRFETWGLASRCRLIGVAQKDGEAVPGLLLRLIRGQSAYDGEKAAQFRWAETDMPDTIRADEYGCFEVPAIPSGTAWWLGPVATSVADSDGYGPGMWISIPEGVTEYWCNLSVP